MTLKNISLVFVLLVFSLVASLAGLGLTYKSYITPTSSLGEFLRIHADTWLEDGAEIRLGNLASRGNRLLLDFNPWRPGELGPANIRVKVCGEVASEFFVGEDKQIIYLTGDCEPRVAHFNVLNPFEGGRADRRALGAQLNSAEVTSRLGFPIVRLDLVVKVAIGIFLLSLFFFLSFTKKNIKTLAFLIPLLSFLLIRNEESLAIFNSSALWLFTLPLFAGFCYASRNLGSNFAGSSRSALSDLDSYFRTTSFLILAIVLAGGLLRFYGIDFGLPASFHPDEASKVRVLTRMWVDESLNPRYFLHPSLLLYLTYFLNSLIYLTGLGGAEWNSTALLSGRMVSALAGTFSLYLVFLIGKRLYGSSAGLIAAAVLAVLPLHVTCSRYLKEDALLVALTLCCVAALLKAVQEDKKGYLLFAGLLAGLSASSKYSGLLSVIIVGSAPWLKSGGWKPEVSYFGYTALALLLFPVGFLMGTPYAYFDYNGFMRGVRYEKAHMLRGHTVSIDAWSQYWMYHFSRSIIPGMSFFSTLLAVFAAGLLLWRRKIEDLFLLSLVLLFYLPAEWVRTKPAPQPERYILPCLPFLAIAVGEGIRIISRMTFFQHLRTKAVGVSLLVALVIFFPAKRSIELASEIRNDTRERMAEWMIENIPHGTEILVDWWPYSPQFPDDNFVITQMERRNIVQQFYINRLREAEQDYLMVSSLFYDRFFSQPKTSAHSRELIRGVFRLPVIKEFAPEHGMYGFHNPTITLFSLKELKEETAEKVKAPTSQDGQSGRQESEVSIRQNNKSKRS